MRHLKLFEGYLEGSFYEIEYQEYLDILEDPIKIDRITVTKLKEIGFEMQWYSEKKSDQYIMLFEGKNLMEHDIKIWVWAIPDEYYIAEILDMDKTERKYYKCDQWEGLMKILRINGVV